MKALSLVVLLLGSWASCLQAQSLGHEAARSELVVTGEARLLNSDERLDLFEIRVTESVRGAAATRIVVAVPRRISNHTSLPVGRPVLVHLVRAPETALFASARNLHGDVHVLRPQPLGTISLTDPEGAELLDVARRLADLDRIPVERAADRARAMKDLFLAYLNRDLPVTVGSLSRDLQAHRAALAELDRTERDAIVNRILTAADPDIIAELIHVASGAEIHEAAPAILDRALEDTTGRLVIHAAGALNVLGVTDLETTWKQIAVGEDLERARRASELVLRTGARSALPRLGEILSTADRDRALVVLSTLRTLPSRMTAGTARTVAEDHEDETVRVAARQLLRR